MAKDTEDDEDRLAREHAFANVPQQFYPGDHVGLSYRVERLLAKGGLSEVYVATHALQRNLVALKVPRAIPRGASSADHARDVETRRAIFTKEAKRLATMAGRGIVGIMELADDPRTKLPFAILELVDGANLASHMQARGHALAVEEATQIIRTLAAILAPLHALDLPHGDLKPSNVMVRQASGHRWTGRSALMLIDPTTSVSWRSPLYLAPEGITHQAMTPGTDVFALGVLFYTLLAGRHPTRIEDPSDARSILRAQIEDQPAPISSVIPAAPPALAAILGKMIAKDPGNRFANAGEVLAALDRCIGELVRLPPIDQVFAIAPPTARVESRREALDDERRWTRHDGVHPQALAFLRAMQTTGRCDRPTLVIVAGPRRLLGLRYALGVGRWTIGSGHDRALVVPHDSVAQTHATITVDANAQVRIAEEGIEPVWIDDVAAREGIVGPRSQLVLGDVCLQLFFAGDAPPLAPAIPEKLFVEAEQILEARRVGVEVLVEIARTTPAPSSPMRTANANRAKFYLRRAEELIEGSFVMFGENIEKLASALVTANVLEARAEICVGLDPNEVVRRRFGMDIDWIQRARARVAARKSSSQN